MGQGLLFAIIRYYLLRTGARIGRRKSIHLLTRHACGEPEESSFHDSSTLIFAIILSRCLNRGCSALCYAWLITGCLIPPICQLEHGCTRTYNCSSANGRRNKLESDHFCNVDVSNGKNWGHLIVLMLSA